MLALAPAGATAQDTLISDSHRAATLELLEAMHAQEGFEMGMAITTDLMARQLPQSEAARSAIDAFLAKYFTWTALQDKYVTLYASAFTESEVRDLLAFYRTPTGAKSADLMPIMARKGAELGQQEVMAHLPELLEMLRAAGR